MTLEIAPATILEAYKQNGEDWAATARALAQRGIIISRDTCRRKVERAGLLERQAPTGSNDERKFKLIKGGLREDEARSAVKGQFTVLNPAPPVIDPTLLLEERIHKFRLQKAAYDANRNVRIKVNIDGPIGIGFMGDPHVDDDGTDLELLFKHAKLLDGSNEGLFGACIGDVRNNWIGRLARLWANQSTSAEEAKVLAEEYLRLVHWLIMIRGNHDCWSGSDDIMDWLLKDNAVVDRASRAQVTLVFPNGREVKIYAAHDFSGKSMWTPAYGAMKKAQLHMDADLYICGHLHSSGYANGYHHNGRMWHACRMASYKKIDDYVEELGIEADPGYECPVAIIDPYATSETNLVQMVFDPEKAADYLAWMRQRHAA